MLEADVEVDRREFTLAVTLQVAPGERLALFGPSGAGKTTALEVIAGLVPPRRGTGGAGRPGAHPDRARRAARSRRGSAGSACSARTRRCSRTSPSGTTWIRTGPRPDQARTERLAASLGIDGLLAAGPPGFPAGRPTGSRSAALLLARCETLLLDEPYTGLDQACGGC